MAIKVKRRPRKIRTPKTLDEKYMGSEPTWTDVVPTDTEMGRAYNWYNYFYGYKESAKLLFDNYPRDKKEVKLLKRLPDWKVNGVVCYQARMMAMGCKLSESSKEYFDSKIDGMLESAKQIREEKKVEKKEAFKPSIQERIREQISEFIGEIEEQVDILTNNKFKSDFNMYKWLQQNNVKQQQSNAIGRYYKPLLTELLEVQGGRDEQLKEAYGNIKKAELKRFVEFIAMIIGDAEAWGANQKTVRKPRIKKPRPIEKQIQKVKYLKEHTELKLVSINPAEIIGSNQLWIFNVKYRRLTRYDAIGPAGFGIKGTTLQGWDPQNSLTKTIRKPEAVLENIKTGGKRVLKKVMDELNTKTIEPNGRINQDCILLRVIK